jgi:hypothetical protein
MEEIGTNVTQSAVTGLRMPHLSQVATLLICCIISAIK